MKKLIRLSLITSLFISVCLTTVPSRAEVVVSVVTFGVYAVDIAQGEAESWTQSCLDSLKTDPFLFPICPLAFILDEKGASLGPLSKNYLAVQGFRPDEIRGLELEGQALIGKQK